MTHKVGPKGQVVIPKDLRDEFGLEPGDEVAFSSDGGQITVIPLHDERPLRGRFRGRGLMAQLERDREQDRLRESAR